jgi:hypothetical protein
MLPVLIAFAGVLVAAVATGMRAGRCVRGPRLRSGTFRVVEIGGQLIAPLWLAWGLVELSRLPFSKAWPVASQRHPLSARSVYPLTGAGRRARLVRSHKGSGSCG